jgi:para-nitrobenzyl esterase
VSERVRWETRSGRVEGRRRDGIAAFRGIPYARAARWASPVREASWAAVRDATTPGAAVPQRPGVLMRMLGMDGLAFDEACLHLNAWTPGPDRARRPVLVWLHGGGFTAGAGSLGIYDGAALARRADAVVVTLNYRLGALGFLALPSVDGDGATGNFGLLDQIAALEWVAEHAEGLGGDPGNVTVFGESAGAMSIGALLGAPRARARFRRAILQSGAAHNVAPLAQGLRVAELFARAAGAAPGDTAALRALSVEAILEAQRRVIDDAWRGIEGLPFEPVVDGDLIPRAPLEAVAAGEARGISVLVGTNLDEWRLYGLADAKLRSLDDAGLLRRLARNPPPGVLADAARDFALRTVEVYRRARAGRLPVDPPELWLALQTDRVFRVPAIRLAEAQARHRPPFAYLFTWASPAFEGRLGSCHGLEVPFVFGSLAEENAERLVGVDDDARRLSSHMQDAWIAFARSGDPGWPRYDPERRETALLGRTCRTEQDPFGAERSAWEGVL